MKLVDVEPILKKNRKTPCWLSSEAAYGFDCGKDSVLEELEDAPKVETKPVIHAYWRESYNKRYFVVCSNCNHDSTEHFPPINDWPYCPHCGAIMDKKEGTNG